MNKRQEELLVILRDANLKDDYKVNALSISKQMGVSRQLISREILGLKAMGKIKRQASYKPVDN